MRNLFIAAILFTASTAHAEDFAAMAKEMTACTSNEECIVVEDVCGGWTGINKKAEAMHADMVTKTRPLANCGAITQTPKPAAAQCAENLCEVKE